MAAFASFHIGEKLKLWNWKSTGIKSFSATCGKKSRTLEDDFQIIRIINNVIYAEIGWVHLAFGQLDFQSFQALLAERKKHSIIIGAFEKLNDARVQMSADEKSQVSDDLIWQANTEILWHEQSQVVQPLFDKLTPMFSRAMTFFASFDYKINHRPTRRRARSRFVWFMMFSGLGRFGGKRYFFPAITNLQHRWHWIYNDILKKWKMVEPDGDFVLSEIEFLANIENKKRSNK